MQNGNSAGAHGFSDLRRFFAAVRQKRQELGLTLADVAVRAEISVPYLCQLEKGYKTNPTMQTVERLARVLDLPFQPVDHDPPALPPDTRARIEEVIQHLPEADRRKLVETSPKARLAWLMRQILHLPGVTREGLARTLQLSPAGLEDILARRTQVNPLVVRRLQQATGIPEDFVFKGLLDFEAEEPQPDWEDLQALLRELATEGVSPSEIRSVLLALRERRRSYYM